MALDKKFTFDTIESTPSNMVILSMAKSTIADPGFACNPFYIVGAEGTGKTEIMHAIGNEFEVKHPNLNVLYVNIKDDKNQPTQDELDKCEVLILDSFEYIDDNTELQERLFGAINRLFLEDKQIVVASEKTADQISSLDPRITHRVAKGFVSNLH